MVHAKVRRGREQPSATWLRPFRTESLPAATGDGRHVPLLEINGLDSSELEPGALKHMIHLLRRRVAPSSLHSIAESTSHGARKSTSRRVPVALRLDVGDGVVE